MELPELGKLLKTVKALRDPEAGCPWDLKQTHKSLLKYLIEESYEFCQAAEEDDFDAMKDELGDVFLQVLLHSQLASENDIFNFEDVAKNLNEKLIRRHPHVFSDAKVKDENEVHQNWQKIKAQEKKNFQHFEIDEKFLNFPALRSSDKIGEKTKELNFDWSDPAQVSYKVEEEWQELKEEIVTFPRMNREKVEEEFGDFLFSAAQLGRHLGIDPEESLRLANKKFIRRFKSVEKLMKADGHKFGDLDQMQLDQYWNKVKQNEKS